ncbi:hypothetical protein BT63DRAFT_410056 [Microthyrium microscopicum]|uniref:Protein kinase domain-containing protein n=1 Tax=Microthyrium microscopicum TaxID=703497 RepID=A0A6A6UL38_9PEZI|nr:hypothetical protein BT63DRAFT_410056 [Microthyrium microscopicum]
MQWKFCPPEIDYHRELTFDARRILPFRCVKQLSCGGFGTTYLIEIHPAYDRLDNQPAESLHLYVLKSFKVEDQNAFRLENESHIALRNNQTRVDPNIIRYHGSFQHDQTFNIILEYADGGTLEDYFRTTTPPQTYADVFIFWRSLLQIPRALNKISNTDRSIPSTNGNEIHRDGHHLRNSYPNGSRTFGPPEHYNPEIPIALRTDLRISPKADVWSFGAIMSLAATWVLKGQAGITAYENQRIQSRQDHAFGDPDSFHDGTDVLPYVHRHHQCLIENHLKKNDVITRKVLDDIIPFMLSNFDERFYHHPAWIMIQKFLDKAEAGMTQSLPAPAYPLVDGQPALQGRVASDPTGVRTTGSFIPYSPPFRTLEGTEPSPILSASPGGLDHHGNDNRLSLKLRRNSGTSINTAFTDTDTHYSQAASSSADNTYGVHDQAHQGLRHSISFSKRPVISPASPFNGEPRAVPISPQVKPTGQPGLSCSEKQVDTRDKVPCTRKATLTDVHSVPAAQAAQAAPVPFWTIDEIKGWRDERTGLDKQWHPELDKRDFIFFIDSSHTMTSHWDKVITFGKNIGYMPKGFDDDGIDLRFTIDSSRQKRFSWRSRTTFTHITALVTEIERNNPSLIPGKRFTNLRGTIGEFLNDYRTRVQDYSTSRVFRTKPKKTILYVLTDGNAWQPEGNDDITDYIRDLVAALHTAGLPDTQFGIQFVQLGDDAKVYVRLDRWDDLKKYEKIAFDIVDNEPFETFTHRGVRVGGNMWKVMLGSINKWADNQNGVPELPAQALTPRNPSPFPISSIPQRPTLDYQTDPRFEKGVDLSLHGHYGR